MLIIKKAFTKHIIDAMMKSFEEKLELEVSIPRKLYDEWEPTIKIKIKDYECHALCDLGASVSTIPTTKKYTSVMIRVCHSRSRFLSCMYIHDKFMTESR